MNIQQRMTLLIPCSVIIVLFVLAIVMTTLLIERLFFYISELKDLSDISYKEVSSYKDVNAWILNKIKSKNISVINVAANRNLLLIQGLIALCPLLGLLGTVTGMIEVFDIMAITGTGNARAMASGIAKATLPTMTGLFISIVESLNSNLASNLGILRGFSCLRLFGE